MDAYTGTRWVELPPGIVVFYEELMDSHRDPFGMCTPEGRPWRRSNFRARYLPYFTFHEGRQTHASWLTEDGIPEVARRARLGQRIKGMARVYDHVIRRCGGRASRRSKRGGWRR